MRISKVQIAECAIPLPHVLRLGPVEIRTRDYVVVRIDTDSGICGEAIGYPRGTPLFETLGAMAQRILGKDARMRRQIVFGLEQSNAPGRAALTRALSLIDIALWDLTAKHASQPLYRLLGGLRTQADSTAVAGYYMDRRSIADISDEVSELLDNGYARVKIMLKGDDAVFDRQYAKAVSAKAPGRVAADAHWSWTTVTEAKRLCHDLDSLQFNFLEDPFSASDWQFTHELRRQITTPIAAGEDVYGARNISDLVSGIDILRVDATTCGGITGASESINLAAAAGRTVLPHVFPPLHVHLACAFPNVEGVEVIPEASGADPLERLLLETVKIEDGKIRPGENPGVGISVNWPAAEALSRKSKVIDSVDATR